MTRILAEIRYSARSFARAPGPALALVCTLALGIGGSLAIAGFVRGFGRSASPVESDERAVSVFGQRAGGLTPAEYARLRRLGGVFEWMGAARLTSGAVTAAGQTMIVPVAATTPELAGALGLNLTGGVAVSRRLRENGVSGEQAQVDGAEERVRSTAPDWLEGLYRERPIDVWKPIRDEEIESGGASPDLWVVGRLRAGVSPERAQDVAGLRVVRYTGSMPDAAAGARRIVWLVQLAAGALLFVACANVASFLLGRAIARSRETSLRVALGAGFGQLARELAADSIVISIVGGAFGLVLAMWTARAIPAFLFEEDAQRLVFAVDPLGMAVRCGACILVTTLCGLAPLFFTPHSRPAAVLRRESAGPSKTIRRLRLGLAAAQMASCCALAVSTAYLFDGFAAAARSGAGRRLGHAIVASVTASPLAGAPYFRRVDAAARATPRVTETAWTGRLPGDQPIGQIFRVEPLRLPRRELTADVAWFTAASMRMFELPPKAGRMFGFGDAGCRAAVVNEEAARKLFGDRTVGRALDDGGGPPIEVVGVVAMRRPGAPPTIYYDHTARTGAPPATIRAARFRTPADSELTRAELEVNVVSPNYFRAMGMPMAAGQGLDEGASASGCRIGVVNREAAELYFGGNAIGSAIIDIRGRRTTIIGVVEAPPLGVFQRRAEPAVYFPLQQDTPRSMTLIAGAAGGGAEVIVELRRRIAAVPGGALTNAPIQTLEDRLKQTALAPLRIAFVMVGASATLALALSAIGLFGALSDTARQRRRELAVRIALGAQRWRVMGLIFGEGGRLALAGAVAGSIAAALLLRWLSRILPGVGAPSWPVWLAAPAALFAAVAIASVLPARRASIIDPVSALREEN